MAALSDILRDAVQKEDKRIRNELKDKEYAQIVTYLIRFKEDRDKQLRSVPRISFEKAVVRWTTPPHSQDEISDLIELCEVGLHNGQTYPFIILTKVAKSIISENPQSLPDALKNYLIQRVDREVLKLPNASPGPVSKAPRDQEIVWYIRRFRDLTYLNSGIGSGTKDTQTLCDAISEIFNVSIDVVRKAWKQRTDKDLE